MSFREVQRTSSFRKFGYWWFRFKKVVYGPYHDFVTAEEVRDRKENPPRRDRGIKSLV